MVPSAADARIIGQRLIEAGYPAAPDGLAWTVTDPSGSLCASPAASNNDTGSNGVIQRGVAPGFIAFDARLPILFAVEAPMSPAFTGRKCVGAETCAGRLVPDRRTSWPKNLGRGELGAAADRSVIVEPSKSSITWAPTSQVED